MPIFHDEKTITPFKRREPIRMGGRNAIIYDADTYHELLAVTKLAKWDDDDVIVNKTVRVSLSVNFQLKFGKEGPPTAVVPAHEKLTGKYSISPGNTSFNAANQVCIVSNKSGDYLPDLNALQYLLIVMMKNDKFTFADSITLRLHKKNSPIEEQVISKDALFAELMQLDFYRNFEARKAAFLEENTEIAATAATFDAALNTPTSTRKKKCSPVKENISDEKDEQNAKQLASPKVNKRIKFDASEFLNPFNHSMELARAATGTEDLPSLPSVSSGFGSLSSSSQANPGLLKLSLTKHLSSKPLPSKLLSTSLSTFQVSGFDSYYSQPPTFFKSPNPSTASQPELNAIKPSAAPLVTDLMLNIPKPDFGPPR